ncbi:hypothetical protein Clacol_006833 [Clathrus columnatus]|uniref:DUF3074 domain-containing protein n=1 Tax=Clathrus columnatus TaxID=1419009 RepID=A0AAV5AIA2_9AGAM|nr:hypothetical protein Clacol_006833 [Clathrus columnatus]
MSQNIVLGIKPYTPSTPFRLALPTEQALIDAGKALFNNLDSWKSVKVYKRKSGNQSYSVNTFVRPKLPTDEVSWFMRHSVHQPEHGSFDDFWNFLGKNKAVNEQEFIPEIKSVNLLKTVSPMQSIWTLYYTFSPPVTPRTFTVLQTVHITGGEHGSPREGWIISVPVDVSEDTEMKAKEAKGTRGRYASVELVKEGQDGTLEWRMATASTPGGLIPKVFVEKSMPSQIEKDVGHFLHWLQGKKGAKSSMTNAVPAPRESTGTNGETMMDNADQETPAMTMDNEATMDASSSEPPMTSTDVPISSDAPPATATTEATQM